MRSMFFAAKRIAKLRVLPCFLALIMLLSTVPMTVFSVDAGEEPVANESTVPTLSELIYDYDTLKITLDGEETYALSLYEHEKIEICAAGVSEQASYQWQIQHNEKDDLWIDIYDATDPALSLTAALIGGVLRDDGTAKVRCRAYTQDCAYLTRPFTVALSQEPPLTVGTVSPITQSLPSFMADASNEFVMVKIEYVQYDFRRDANGDLVVDGEDKPVLDDGKQAFTPYIATIKSGTSLNTTVHFPTMIGYDSFFEDRDTPSTSYEISLTEVNTDIIYTVKYKPALVDYSVRYYFQNIYDDLYVEDTDLKVNDTGFTGATPPDSILQKEVPGFTALYYQPDAIAADGSTVFEVYYERNYYLMEFDCNGGYGAETIYVRYGSYVSVPQPVKAGYVFSGWDLVKSENPDDPITEGDGTVEPLPSSLPPYNMGYKAAWDTANTKYTLVFWRENANDPEYSYWGTASSDAVSATVLVPIEVAKRTANSAVSKGLDEATHFTLNEAATIARNPETVVVAGDGSSIVNVYYSRNYYTLKFVWGSDGRSTCAHEHIHTDSCYAMLCDVHEHTANCYVCKLEEHTHTTACCSLYHVHSDACGYACGKTEHTAHTIECYTFTGGNVDTEPSDVDGLSRLGSYGEVDVYYRRNIYYVNVNGSYYRIRNFNNYSFKGTLSIASCPNITLHTHGTTCGYKCGTTEHTHDTDEVCDTEDCVNNGLEHAHGKECYLCSKEEQAHTDACCSLELHQHTSCSASKCIHTCSVGCYTENTLTVATGSHHGFTASINTITDPSEATIYRYCRYNSNDYYYNYVYIDGTWYYLGTSGRNTETIAGFTWSGNASTSQGDVTKSNTKNEPNNCSHAHIDQCYSCGKKAHSHGNGFCNFENCSDASHHVHHAECYLCGKDHQHDASCERALTCILTEHTHTTGCYSSSTSNLVYSITAKYDADISRVWEEEPIKGHLDNGVVWQSSATGKYYSFLEKVPNDNITLTYTSWSGSTYTWYYYLEVSPYENTNDLITRVDGNVTYKYYHTTSVKGSGISLTYEEDYFPITGYYQRDNDVPSFDRNNQAYLYYRIRSRTLRFYNRSDLGPTPAQQTLVYNQSLANFEISKTVMERDYYPSGIEPGAYEFGGWYTSPGCYDGTEVDWDSMVMPDSDLELYAKWTPILRDVTFYTDYADISDPDASPFLQVEDVPHGTLLGSAYNKSPDKGEGYDFVGWFYMDEDNKKRFAPDSMEITRDLVLFAEWQTSIDTTYEIKYALKDAVSAENVPSKTNYPAGTLIADTLFAHSSVGKTKTFSAKGLGELDADFQKKFFPTVNTHSILMEPNGELNKYTFEYVYDDTVYYKVRYVDFATRTELRSSVVKSSENAIVTEKFLPISGYIPQNFYIRKALAYDGDVTEDSVIEENVITFYYVQDTKHGLYSVEYYLENPDSTDPNKSENYFQYESIVGSEDINHLHTADIRTYEGYTYVPELNTVITYKADGSEASKKIGDAAGNPPSGIVDYTGLTIKIYYKRNLYPYIIEYREYGAPDTAPALWSETGNEKFDTDIDHTAEASLSVTEGDDTFIYEYYLPDATVEERTKTMTIRVANAGEENPNKLIFYYIKKQVTVIYEAVCTVPTLTNFGYVSFYSESAAVASALSGSDAMPDSGFRFVGWYTDADCKNPVNPDWRYNGTTPDPNGTKLKPGTLDPNVDEVRYYALFEPICSSMTITKTVKDNGTEIDPTDHFLFRVQGQSNNSLHIDLIVSIQGSGSVTLTEVPIGDFIVTELTEWSWDYSTTDATKEVKVTTETPGNATFENNSKNSNWLSGETAKDNEFN